jgi:RimJ/RimL family protein N-acetyltransferase
MPDSMQDPISLRSATVDDCRRFWEWRNEPSTRESSVDTSVTPLEDHEKWYFRKLQEPDTKLLVIMDSDQVDIGYIRFDIGTDDSEISVSLEPGSRHKGYGTAAIRMSSEDLLATGVTKKIVALIKENNQVSVAAFQRAGFVGAEKQQISGIEFFKVIFSAENHTAPNSGQVIDG